jgi:hypothetical protein
MPWLRQLHVGLSPQRTRFSPSPVHVGFVENEVAMGPFIFPVLQFSPLSIILPVLHIHSSVTSAVWSEHLTVLLNNTYIMTMYCRKNHVTSWEIFVYHSTFCMFVLSCVELCETYRKTLMNTGCVSKHIHIWQVMLKMHAETITGHNGLRHCQILTRIGIYLQVLVEVPVICSSNNTYFWSDANVTELF